MQKKAIKTTTQHKHQFHCLRFKSTAFVARITYLHSPSLKFIYFHSTPHTFIRLCLHSFNSIYLHSPFEIYWFITWIPWFHSVLHFSIYISLLRAVAIQQGSQCENPDS